MEKLIKLLTLLTVNQSNFKVLHWNSVGKEFDTIHKLASDWSDQLYKDIDEVAEMILMLDGKIYNYIEISDLAKEYNIGIAGSNENYNYDEFVTSSEILLTHIVQTIQEVLDDSICEDKNNVGIKSTLEAMYMTYDKELRYLNKRRSM